MTDIKQSEYKVQLRFPELCLILQPSFNSETLHFKTKKILAQLSVHKTDTLFPLVFTWPSFVRDELRF